MGGHWSDWHMPPKLLMETVVPPQLFEDKGISADPILVPPQLKISTYGRSYKERLKYQSSYATYYVM